MEIRKRIIAGSGILELAGEFDLNEVEIFEQAFRSHAENPECKRIILDFDQLSFLGSSGISSLISMSRQMGSDKEGTIYLFRANDYIRDLVKMTGIEAIVKLINAWDFKKLTGQELDA